MPGGGGWMSMFVIFVADDDVDADDERFNGSIS